MPRTREILCTTDPEWMEIARQIDTCGSSHRIYTRASLIYAKHKFGENTRGAEIGVWSGDLSSDILEFMKPESLLLVDPWFISPDFLEELKSVNAGEHMQKQEYFDFLHNHVCERFKNVPTVRVLRALSVDGARQIEDESLDWVYVDGSHKEEYVYEDLVSWLPKIRPGGILCGHDYLFREVEQALLRFEKDSKLELIPFGSDWWINKP